MSLYLSKVLSLLIHPLVLGLLLSAIGGVVAVWRRRWGVSLVGLGLLVIWIPATPLVANELRGSLESAFPPTPASAAPSADAIVVLGGAIGAPRPPRVYPDLSGAADRVWHAARLYRAGKAPVIVASGGSLPWRDQRFREAEAMQALLTTWGVPSDSVLLESRSANTYQNATNTAEIAGRRGFDRVLLVTSALHMRRALATFRAAGVTALPAATDYHVVQGPTTLLDALPDVGALGASTAAIREYVGYLVYDWRGWIAAGRPSVEPTPSAFDQMALVRSRRTRAASRLRSPFRS
ncbi:MAG: YdcF family protein [Salinibacter sp.]